MVSPDGPPSTKPGPSTTTGARSALAFTGAAGLQLATAVAVLLLVLGTGTFLVCRRRRRQSHNPPHDQ
ncbi:hypothetical protein [Curtobacterium sp. MMLR14_010]|uniref:hypothetical protein n=1 Tax=Curtobacterium sp. MMLR14_010 TaxID=1898743 RepID=UPI0011145C53|nr:hypothetical protein [Curtobacterium sp. MMLR14_010]